VPILVGWENAPLQAPLTEADMFSLLAGQKKLPIQPGTEFRYSSGDYFLLGQIVKRISGQSVGEFARQRVFEPLGMQRTFFDENPTRVTEQRAVGHWKPSGDTWSTWRPTAHWPGGGGMYTCVEDLVRWDRNFASNRLPRGKYLDAFFSEGSLLGNSSCLDVDAYRKETNPEARSDSPPGQYRGERRQQFTGGAWGETTALTQFPDRHFTVICLSNCDEITAWNINRQIADLFLADALQPLPQRPSRRPVSELPTAEVTESELRDKVGAYRLMGSGIIWKIALQGDSLQMIDHLGKTVSLRPLSATRFDPEGFYATTSFFFSRMPDGGPMTFTSQWDEPDGPGKLRFEPVELVSPTQENLAKYEGEYVSEELAATYRFMVREGALWLRVNSRRWEQLDGTVRDEFVPHVRAPTEGRIIRFMRGASGDVVGLEIDYYRVTGVQFTKR
jgi:hypothetical protein